MKLTAQNNTAFTDMNKLNMKPTAQSNNRELMWHEAKSNMELMNMIKEEINNQRKNVEKGVSHSDTLWTKTATSDADALSLTAIDGRRNPQDCSGQANKAKKEDTNKCVLPVDFSYKCGHKTKGMIFLDDNLLSMSAYIQWAEEENNLETKEECFDCYLKKLE